MFFWGDLKKRHWEFINQKPQPADKVVAVPGKSETYFIESMEFLGTKRDGDLIGVVGCFFLGQMISLYIS